jgi:hypothetical protein
MHRIVRVVLATSLLTVIPLPMLMKSCGGGGMGHMEARTGAGTARIEGGFGLSSGGLGLNEKGLAFVQALEFIVVQSA